MSNEKLRELFEANWKGSGCTLGLSPFETLPGGEYKVAAAEIAWRAWKDCFASLSAFQEDVPADALALTKKIHDLLIDGIIGVDKSPDEKAAALIERYVAERVKPFVEAIAEWQTFSSDGVMICHFCGSDAPRWKCDHEPDCIVPKAHAALAAISGGEG